MNNDVLALKYRPKFFNEVTGQDLVIETLSNSISLGKLHNSYLFSGTRGMGKTTIARLFAKSLLCHEGIKAQPCGRCSACMEIDSGNHLDLIEIDAASRTKAEDTRTLMDNVQYSPSSSRFKIYLIDEVHMLSTKSFNALLKTIEEPPAHVKFLLATTEPEKLPETILSRCLHFKLASATTDIIISHLENILKKEKHDFEPQALVSIANSANGSIRDSLSILEQCIAFCNGDLKYLKIKSLLGEVDVKLIEEIIASVLLMNPNKLIASINNIDLNTDYENVMSVIINIFYKLSLHKINPKFISSDDTHISLLTAHSIDIKLEDIQLFYQIAISSIKDFRYSNNKKDHFIMTLLRMILFTDGMSESSSVPEHIIPSNIKLSKNNTQESNDSQEINDKKDVSENIEQDWNNLVYKLDLNGLTLHLAKHSTLSTITDGACKLNISTNKKDIYPKSCLSDLMKKIKDYYGNKIIIEVDYSDNLLTPAVLEDMNEKNKIDDTLDKIKDDPNINKIQKYFDADIDKQAIKKTTD